MCDSTGGAVIHTAVYSHGTYAIVRRILFTFAGHYQWVNVGAQMPKGPGALPQGRCFHGAAYIGAGRVLIFGGIVHCT